MTNARYKAMIKMVPFFVLLGDGEHRHSMNET